ncbi:MAG TPA: DUF1028 domain-containing protein [Asanoa sp.]|jgi:uncharacterized Ntn-hydrolase superfamily protein|nr:DUF1028 domain-containing protein [Asanoa sp.]
MTFSIVARSADGHSHGIAVASKFLAVGAAVPAAEAQIGAVATQSYANLAYRPQALALLRTGVDAAGVVAGLTAADEGRTQRQVGVVGATGSGATYTGADCHDWAGGVAGDGFAIQGNILVGPEVVDAMKEAWLGSDPAEPLARRLLAALRAGDEAGGDKRGRQSAALLVVARGEGYGGTSDIVVDLRVDDHAEPVPEMARLLHMHELLFGKPDPATLLTLDGPLAAEVRGRLVAAGHEGATLDDALASWAGVENLEERIVPGKIDPLVLAHLRKAD